MTIAAWISCAPSSAADHSRNVESKASAFSGRFFVSPVSDGPDFTAGWEGNSFKSPPYYGVRGTWWLTDLGKPNPGLSIDYTHAKVYADDETFDKTPGWTHFEFTDRLNLLTLNGIYRFQQPDRKWTPYVGAGVGINMPHVEVTRPSGRTFDYEVGGVTLQAQAGITYQISERWSVFGECKGNYSFVDVPIDSGARLKTDIITNAVNSASRFTSAARPVFHRHRPSRAVPPCEGSASVCRWRSG